MSSKRKHEDDISGAESKEPKRHKFTEQSVTSPFLNDVRWQLAWAMTKRSPEYQGFVIFETTHAITRFVQTSAAYQEAKTNVQVAHTWLLSLVQDLEINQPLSDYMKHALMRVLTQPGTWTGKHFTDATNTCKAWSTLSLAEIIISWMLTHGFESAAEKPWMSMMNMLADQLSRNLKLQLATLASICARFNDCTYRLHLQGRAYPKETVQVGIAVLLSPCPFVHESLSNKDYWYLKLPRSWEEEDFEEEMKTTVASWQQEPQIFENAERVLVQLLHPFDLVRIVREYFVSCWLLQ